MGFWSDIEKQRRTLKMSRAELARRAGISESTIFKGLQNSSRPNSSVRKQVELVVAMEAQLQADMARDER